MAGPAAPGPPLPVPRERRIRGLCDEALVLCILDGIDVAFSASSCRLLGGGGLFRRLLGGLGPGLDDGEDDQDDRRHAGDGHQELTEGDPHGGAAGGDRRDAEDGAGGEDGQQRGATRGHLVGADEDQAQGDDDQRQQQHGGEGC